MQMGDLFKRDSKDRKRRFLRGLNRLLGHGNLVDKDIELREAIRLDICRGVLGLRENLANIYCLEFTKEEIVKLINDGITTGEFTEKYVEVIYEDRGNVDLNTLIGNSIKDGAIVFREMDKAPKYGLNGSEWCDVAKGPCSCGAWHH